MEQENPMPELIIMLTHHDETVPDALQRFDQLKDVPVKHWGFKDVGLPPAEMGRLVAAMKAADKTTYLEVVSLTEDEGLRGARLAVELGLDVLMGTVWFPSIGAYLQDKPIRYYPFPGHVHGHPSILDGSIEAIVADARRLQATGVHGLDLLTYRYTGDAFRLLSEVVAGVRIPLVSAGSIASFERIVEVRRAGAWGFTIGSAFFERAFVPAGSFNDNVLAVVDWLQRG